MPLWNNTDAVGSKPKWVNLSNYPAGTNLVFVDQTEAGLASNKSKGITGAGWWLTRSWTDQHGTIRYWAENLVALTNTAAAAGDQADDLIVPDVQTAIAISVQPANQNTSSGAATFSVTAAFSAGTGTLTYQWQKKSGTKWNNVVGATSDSLALTTQTSTNTGDQYRVVVAGGGAKAVTSNAATLTFVS